MVLAPKDAAGGTPAAVFVLVGENGITPPM